MATFTNTKRDWNGQLTECSIEVQDGSFTGNIYQFPIIRCDLNSTQDVVQHKYPQIGGASIESTGLNPTTFKVEAPFLVGMQRGNGESWNPDDLYPVTFTNIVKVFQDPVSPTLLFTHPTMGQYLVKVQSFNTSVVENIKNGQMLNFDLIEHTKDITNQVQNGATADWGDAKSASSEWDFQITNFDPPIPTSSVLRKKSLTDYVNELQGLIDGTLLSVNQVFMKIQNTLFEFQQIRNSVLRFEDAVDQRTGQVKNAALYVALHAQQGNLLTKLERVEKGVWALASDQPVNAPEAARLAAQQQRQQALNNSNGQSSFSSFRQLRVYVLDGKMSLGQVALVLRNKIDDLIGLNPGISRFIVLPTGTQVVYFA